MHNEPKIIVHSDRATLFDLEVNYPDLVDLMRRRAIGKIDEQTKRVQFCGLAKVRADEIHVFVPLHAECSTSIAALTMQTLEKYSKSYSRKSELSGHDEKNVEIVEVISALLKDFAANGLYAPLIKERSKRSGKPDWAETMRRERGFISKRGMLIYENIRSKVQITNNKNILTLIQAEALREISKTHSWWIKRATHISSDLNKTSKPSFPRARWVDVLLANKEHVYAERALRLTDLLVRYFQAIGGTDEHEQWFGLEDFHWVWEHMLKQTLCNVEEGWNSKLPYPVYIDKDGKEHNVGAHMEIDIVIKDEDCLHVVDAKYYSGIFKNTVPKWSDIVKQYGYVQAMKSLGHNDVHSWFVFPSNNNEGKYEKIVMKFRQNHTGKEYDSINIRYKCIEEIMNKFIDGKFISLK